MFHPLPVANTNPVKFRLGFPSIYAPDQLVKSPKFDCENVECVNTLTFLYDVPPLYPQQLKPFVILNPALYLAWSAPSAVPVPPVVSQYACPVLPPDLRTEPKLLASCVGSVTNGDPFCSSCPVKSMLPLTLTVPVNEAPPAGNETDPDSATFVTSSTLILDAIIL